MLTMRNLPVVHHFLQPGIVEGWALVDCVCVVDPSTSSRCLQWGLAATLRACNRRKCLRTVATGGPIAPVMSVLVIFCIFGVHFFLLR